MFRFLLSALALTLVSQNAVALNVGAPMAPRAACAGLRADAPMMKGYRKASYAERLKGPSKGEMGRAAAQIKREAKAAAEAAAEAAAAAAEAAAAAAEAAEAEAPAEPEAVEA